MPDRLNIKALRSSMGMDTETFGERLGVAGRTVRRWEAGAVKPSPLAMRQLRSLQKPTDNSSPRRRDYEPQPQQPNEPATDVPFATRRV